MFLEDRKRRCHPLCIITFTINCRYLKHKTKPTSCDRKVNCVPMWNSLTVFRYWLWIFNAFSSVEQKKNCMYYLYLSCNDFPIKFVFSFWSLIIRFAFIVGYGSHILLYVENQNVWPSKSKCAHVYWKGMVYFIRSSCINAKAYTST